jgi:hypothetical protein
MALQRHHAGEVLLKTVSYCRPAFATVLVKCHCGMMEKQRLTKDKNHS